MDISKLFSELKKPLVLDGAVGSFLQNKIDADNPLWSSLVNIKGPQKVIDLHKEYVAAGADIITTNTFRTNYNAYKESKINIKYEQFVKKSVELATVGRDDANIIIAGSNPPAEDCYQIERKVSQNDLKYNHEKHIELLWQSGVDFILNETQSHFDEIEMICKYCSENKIPFAISLYLNDNLELLSGHRLKEVLNFIQKYDPLFISFNCMKEDLLNEITNEIELNFRWGFYLNLGADIQSSEVIICGVESKTYSEMVKKYLKWNPVIIGACCGSNPSHIKELRKKVDEIY